jgi:hypothetical protein
MFVHVNRSEIKQREVEREEPYRPQRDNFPAAASSSAGNNRDIMMADEKPNVSYSLKFVVGLPRGKHESVIITQLSSMSRVFF